MLDFDPRVIIFLNAQKKLNSRHAKWVLYLREFAFVVYHISNAMNKVSDAPN